jgi:hypothetical protein
MGRAFQRYMCIHFFQNVDMSAHLLIYAAEQHSFVPFSTLTAALFMMIGFFYKFVPIALNKIEITAKVLEIF